MKTTTMKKVNKFRLNAIKATLAVTTAMMLATNGAMLAFAGNTENSNPTGLGGGTTMSTAVSIVFWAVRVIVLLAGGAWNYEGCTGTGRRKHKGQKCRSCNYRCYWCSIRCIIRS